MMCTKILIYIMIWLCAINSAINAFDDNDKISKIGIFTFLYTLITGLIIVLYSSLF